MSFKEQKIVRLFGRMVGNVNIIGVVYEDGRKETIVHLDKKRAFPRGKEKLKA